MSFFKRKTTPDASKDASKEGAADGTPSKDAQAAAKSKGPVRDERKARRFFEHAQAMAETRNYDYAIELYTRGLAHAPDAIEKHQALHDVALKRKIAGGKPAGFKEKMAFGLKDPVEKMLHAEMLWAKEPLSLQRMMAVMEKAVEADSASTDFNLAEIAYWLGELILEKNQTDKPPTKEELLKVRDWYSTIEVWDKAALACQMALELAPDDMAIMDSLKEIQAEQMMATTRPETAEGSVRDMEKQRDLEKEGVINKTDSVKDEIIAKRRGELEDDPKDLDKVVKLIEALLDKEDEPSTEEAIKLLGSMLEQTGQYRYKVRIGDAKIKQYARTLRDLKTRVDSDKNDTQARKDFERIYRERMNFELQEFNERVKNYPTDLGLKFELGRRLFAFKKFDEAIGMFQQSKADPKYRAVCHEFLGRCFLAQDWLDEAVETLEEGRQHINNNPRLALELRWTLMEAYERVALRDKSSEQGKKAYKLASEILQSNINFRDIKERATKMRELVKQLQAAEAGEKA